MGKKKVERLTSVLISVVVILLSLCVSPDWYDVGIYSDCELQGRLLYSFFHVNPLHAILNSWCLLSIVFIYDISKWRMLLAYLVASFVPVGLFSKFLNTMAIPTVGLSSVVFFLFGSISFEVVRKWYYQSWMIIYLVAGFLFRGVNAWLHLYCYSLGFIVALLNKPINTKRL